MIQRIQTLYLLLAGLFPAFTLFVPLVVLSNAIDWLSLNSLGYEATAFPEMAGRHPYGLLVFTVLAVVLPLIALFGYKNRKKQMKWVNVSMLINVLWYVALVVYTLSVQHRTDTIMNVQVGCAFPLLALLVLFLAKRAIKHDEALVRAADRIR